MIKAKIIKGIGGFYYCKPLDSFLDFKNQLIECKPRGVFRYQNIKPVVGDEITLTQEKEDWVISEISSRKNELKRPSISNVDLGLICIAAESPTPNLVSLDTLLINCEINSIQPIICITKADLDLEKAQYIKEVYEKAGYTVILLSTKIEDEIDKLIELIKGKTAFLAGISGVGKSTLSNRLCKTQMETGNISKKLKRGKHTTRHVELLETKFNGYLLDTPGFSTLELEDSVTIDNLRNTYPDFRDNNCYYDDCNHIKEPKCEVRQKVKEGKIDLDRYKRYKDLFEIVNQKKRY